MLVHRGWTRLHLANLLHRHDVRRWGKLGQSASFKAKVRRELIPPLLQSNLLGLQTFPDLLLSILKQWVVHVYQNLVEDYRQATHAHET